MMSRIYALEHGLPHCWNPQSEAMPPSVLSYNRIPTSLPYDGLPTIPLHHVTSAYLTSPIYDGIPAYSGTPTSQLHDNTSVKSAYNTLMSNGTPVMSMHDGRLMHNCTPVMSMYDGRLMHNGTPMYDGTLMHNVTPVMSTYDRVPTSSAVTSPTLSTTTLPDKSMPTLSSCTSLSSITSSDAPCLITSDKENNPLPNIDHTKLIDPQEVVDRNPRLLNKAKLPTLAVRLGKEAYFGPEIMILCTVRGVGSFHALPRTELDKLKSFLCKLALPRFIDRRVEFEEVWKSCINSIGQACKNYRIEAAAAASEKSRVPK